MKMNYLRKAVTLSLGLALMVGFTSGLSAAETGQGKGAQKLLKLNRIATAQDAAAVKAGDRLVMSCAKCKTTTVTLVNRAAKGAEVLKANGKPTRLARVHQCPGCKSTIELKGHGKGAKAELVHSCKACGDHSAYCCVMKKAGGAKNKAK